MTGANGAGKSTLLALLHGDLPPTAGSVQRAARLRTALLAQDVVFPEPAASARDTYRAALGEARAEAVPLSAARPGAPAATSTARSGRSASASSGGSRSRWRSRDPPDLLLLDEPTNHLSLALAEDLEEALGAHPGAVVLASHDRWLRRRWSSPVLPLG